MPVILEKGIAFDLVPLDIQKELEGICEQEFRNAKKIHKIIRKKAKNPKVYIFYILDIASIKKTQKCRIYYKELPSDQYRYEVGKIKAVE